MKLFTKAQLTKLTKQGADSEAAILKDGKTPDHKPVVKLFGGSAFTALISELHADGETVFGLFDYGHGSPELGYAQLSDLKAARFKPFGMTIERDRYFDANQTLVEYAREASSTGRIIA